MKRLIPLCLALLLAGCGAAVPPAPEPPASASPTSLPEIAETTLPPILSPEEVILSRMTLRQKVGQLFIVRPDALELSYTPAQIDDPATAGITSLTDSMILALETYPVGGFILFSKNLQDPRQLKSFSSQLQGAVEISPFLAVDEEGGAVARLGNHRAFGLPRYPSAGSIGSSGNPEDAYEMGRTIGGYLKEYGFNMDFAPVADVNTNPANPVIGSRAFSPDPEQAAACARAMADGLTDQGIAPVFKHFPGHGDTSTDSHTGLANSNRNLEQLEACELIPFRKATDRDCIMVGHIGMPEITGDQTPSTLSRSITTGLLRQHLDFKGLVITDSLSMGAITQIADSSEAALSALEAGADILLMPQSLPEAFEAVVQAVETGSFPLEDLDQRVLRILNFKIENRILIP